MRKEGWSVGGRQRRVCERVRRERHGMQQKRSDSVRWVSVFAFRMMGCGGSVDQVLQTRVFVLVAGT